MDSSIINACIVQMGSKWVKSDTPLVERGNDGIKEKVEHEKENDKMKRAPSQLMYSLALLISSHMR